MGLHVLVENKFFGAQQEKYPKPALPVVVLPFFKAASKSQKKKMEVRAPFTDHQRLVKGE